MGPRRSALLCAALSAALGPGACRDIEGLGNVTYDLGPDGGGGGTPCACPGSPPWGWSGPVAVYEGPPGTSPDCPGEYPTSILRGGTGLAAAPATCAACTCGAATATCSPGSVQTHSHPTCNGSSTTVTPVPGACTAFTPGSNSFVINPPSSNVGVCSPAGGKATGAPLSWTTEAVVCGLVGQGTSCPNGGTSCPPAPPQPFEPRTCIWRSGSHPCPSPFSTARGWASAADTRACSPCTCGAPSGSACSVATTLFTDGSCKTPLVPAVADGMCVQEAQVLSLQVTVTPGSTTCAPGGGTPTGAASASEALTVCCAP